MLSNLLKLIKKHDSSKQSQMTIFTGLMSVKFTGRVDAKESKIGLKAEDPRTHHIETMNKLKTFKVFIEQLKDQECQPFVAILLSFTMDDFCEIQESLIQDLFDMKAYDVLLNYLNSHRGNAILKKVMNPLIQKLAMLKDKELIYDRLKELLKLCDGYVSTCKDNEQGKRDEVQDWYGEINPFLKHTEFGKFLKTNDVHRIMLRTLVEEFAQTSTNLLGNIFFIND